jgi:hypothetical protein
MVLRSLQRSASGSLVLAVMVCPFLTGCTKGQSNGAFGTKRVVTTGSISATKIPRLKIESVGVEDVVRELHWKFGIRVCFESVPLGPNEKIVDEYRKREYRAKKLITIDVRDVSLAQFLDYLVAQDTDYAWCEIEKTDAVLIYPAKKSSFDWPLIEPPATTFVTRELFDRSDVAAHNVRDSAIYIGSVDPCRC